MQIGPIDPAGVAVVDTMIATRPPAGVREPSPGAGRPPGRPRADIAASWHRLLNQGLDPDEERRTEPLPRVETERRRYVTPLREVLPTLRDGLVPIAEAAQHVMVVTDADGRLLWREGEAAVLRKADAHGFVLGADLTEKSIGTNAAGTVLVIRRPLQVHATEHFLSAHQTWTCAGAPLTDPRDGRLIGVVTVSGPASTVHPATLALVTSVARLAEAELRHRHLAALDRLRGVASPLLGRLTGRALAVDADGWPAAVIGMPPPGRLPLPGRIADGRCWLPSLGMCAVEPLPGGWLVRVDEPPKRCAGATTRVVLDLSVPRRASVTVSGDAGSWTQELSPRHADLLYAMALHREGLTAAQLAEDVFDDPTRTVTVRAEMSRLRRHLAQVLASRPYRFAEGVEVEVARVIRQGPPPAP
ncbi:GAF domain-containing protein [Streptomyces sp. NPDC020965]|uniref:helix-turn-helix domain-containing protein n=1 Tax=Streptomyces sp. NPDC020965 TaxID=3365105 RepID=UPI00378A0AB5